MTLSNLSCALVQIVSVRNANRASRDALRALDDPTPEDLAQIEFWSGRVAGLSQALDILRVIGEQPIAAAEYIAGHDDQATAVANIAALVGPAE